MNAHPPARFITYTWRNLMSDHDCNDYLTDDQDRSDRDDEIELEDWDEYGDPDPDEVMTPEGPADMLLAEVLGCKGDPWGDADL